MLQTKAGYIDARPLATNSSKSSCYARPDHTFGSNPEELSVSICGLRFTRQRTWQQKLITSESCQKQKSVGLFNHLIISREQRRRLARQ
jgi:hypothetical protein